MAKVNYDIDVYCWEELTCKVHVRGTDVTFENFTDKVIMLPFGVRTSVTYQDLLNFYESRCFPKERENCKEILNLMGLDYYDEEAICRITHGTQFDDFMWMNFSDGEQVTFEGIRLR